MEEAVYYILSALAVTATLCISAIHSQDTTESERLYPLPKETPAPPLTIESEVIGPFRVWHIVGFCAVGVLVLMVIVCCCVDVRIPRTKEEIEESYQNRILNKQFTKDMNSPFGPYSRSDESPKSLPNRIPQTNPAFTSDDADIIYASEPRKTPRSLPQRSESLQKPAQVSRNTSSVSNIYDYQIRKDDVSTSRSNISNYSRKKTQASFNGSADIENSQNFQRERLANQSSRSQQLAVAPKPRPAARLQRRFLQGPDSDVTTGDKASRTRDKISRIARFGVQTPLADHPAIILGPKREPHEGHPSLAATARTLIAMSPHPGQLGRR